jgi:hypothetical protein
MYRNISMKSAELIKLHISNCEKKEREIICLSQSEGGDLSLTDREKILIEFIERKDRMRKREI